jgi:hypothetical protein
MVKISNSVVRKLAASLVIIPVLAAASCTFAGTAVVFSSIPNLDVVSTSGGLWCSTCGGVYETLDNFTLGQSERIDGFNLVTGDAPYDANDQFTIEIYSSDHANIIFSEAVTATFIMSTPDRINPSQIVTGELSGLILSAGSYWFAAVNDSELGLPGFGGGNGSLIETFPHTGELTTPQFTFGDIGYQLLSTVPEPATWAMMLVGFGGLGVAMRSCRMTSSHG